MQDARCRIQEAGGGRQQGLLILVTCLLLALAVPVLAQVSSNYDLSWHVIAGGSGRMENAGGHALLGTAGQSLLGPMASSGGHALCGGLWCGVGERSKIYLPVVVRNS